MTRVTVVNRPIEVSVSGGRGPQGDAGPPGATVINGLAIATVPISSDPVANRTTLNAALADPNNSTVMLPAGTMLVDSTVRIPSGKTLKGAGVERTTIKAAPGFTRLLYKNAIVSPELDASNIGVEDLTVDASKQYHDNTVSAANRLCGLLFHRTNKFFVRNVNVKNCTAYGHYCAGFLDGTGAARNGYYENCRAENCNVNFESQDAYNITYVHCHSRAGDGDILCEAHYHPYVLCNKITYRDCTADGPGWGALIINTTADQYDITIDNCYFRSVGGGAALGVDGPGFLHRLSLVNSTFESTGQQGADLRFIKKGKAIGCNFYGQNSDNSPAFGVLNSANSEMEFSSCHARGNAVVGTVNGYGIDNTSSASRWIGGILEGVSSGATGVSSLNPITIDASTRLIPAVTSTFNDGTAQTVVDHVGTVVDLKSALGWYRATKTTASGTWANAKTSLVLDGDFIITAVPRVTGDATFGIGVSTVGGSLYTSSDMKALFYVDGSGALSWRSVELGLNAGGIYIPYEPLHMVRKAGVISFYKGGSIYTEGRLLGTMSNSDTLGLDVTMLDINTAVDLRVGK